MAPKILLSVNTHREPYIEAVSLSGGIPTAQYCPEISTNYDGLILCGGNDIDPTRYGEEINGAVNIDYERDRAEFALVSAFIKAGKPVLGICRGHQLLNVMFGGNLDQHIPEYALHTSSTEPAHIHSVRAIPGSVCAELYGENFTVNSYHHQAVKALGKGLIATVTWEDGMIEGFEHESLPILGVQWHPERMCFHFKRSDTVDGAKLFSYFIGLCS